MSAPAAPAGPDFAAFLAAWREAGLYPLEQFMIDMAAEPWEALDAGQREAALAAIPDLARRIGSSGFWPHAWLELFNPRSPRAQQIGALP